MSGTATVGSVSDRSEPHDDPDSDVAPPTERPVDGPAADAGAGDEPAAEEAEFRDELPDDLDISGFVGPYVFPNNNRRRVPGYLYALLGLVCIGMWAFLGDGGVLVNGGILAAGIALMIVGAYHLVAGWNLDVDERDALVAATQQVAFPVGHASAQLGWRGLLSRPTWRILLYSAENPPTRRGLVLVDGVDGEIISWFTEDNPEDWSDLDGELGTSSSAS